MGEGIMRITVVGAILIIAGTVVVILVLGNLLNKAKSNAAQDSFQ